MNKTKKYLPLLLGVSIAVGIFIGGKLNFSDSSDKLFTTNSKKDKLNRLIDFIDYEYVDAVNTDSIVDVTVNAILENLDPHSVYIPKEDMQRVSENMKGDFVGIGVSFYTYKDTIAVIRPVSGGPSEKIGIKGGDRILYADEDTLFGKNFSNEFVVSKLKGKINEEVNLKVYRKSEDTLLDFKVKRNHVPIKSIDAAYMLTDDLAYVKINRFAESTYKEFKQELTKLRRQGATQIALDLRGNPGGFLNIAEKIVDEFLEADKLILFTKNKRGNIDRSFATKRGDFEDAHVFVLIDENSASASEIIAGALQDNDKGTIVGRRSYGKGLVQREMQLGDGSAVRLTVSRYYTPTGRSIQRSYENGNKDYYDEYFSRLESGELVDPEKMEIADSLKFVTPKGKVVYGGGGIIPDVFVPLDLSMQNETFGLVTQTGLVNYFVFEQLDKQREAYDGLTREDFINDFIIGDDVVEGFKEYIRERFNSNVEFQEEIKQYIKASLGDQLYGNGTYEQVINQQDIMIEKVIVLSQQN
ncbi:S41 family peptidase [Oceanihabitans sediminis]|uniref:S41 family peptidase n=1 Tax=Oceanihabitans sediminis TaxID=1812012 RepID=A0A368P6H5_9FLAO|nr:S41 family peptidase [Oceanihabitans sediminis]MDX1278585.1 S41 family peptidase [Oceanihabitans sediminis]MDX1772786.1 S41 family peptidase [Oceanihabitans sediminis]RBP34457.1 carboxyl-terminal processing protease [Oceanihabitans sediminis]RCU58128.1 S41 family peptidase [Oceanihabitans sediminis]